MLVITLVVVLIILVVTIIAILVSEQIGITRNKRRNKTLESLKVNDEIEIFYNGFDKKAIFKGFIDRCNIHVIVFKNSIAHSNIVLHSSVFIRKI